MMIGTFYVGGGLARGRALYINHFRTWDGARHNQLLEPSSEVGGDVEQVMPPEPGRSSYSPRLQRSRGFDRSASSYR